MTRAERPGPVARLGALLTRWSERYLPDPFLFALLLTALAFALGLAFFAMPAPAAAPATAPGFAARAALLAEGWASSLFGAAGLTFAFQMCLVLVTGHALALSRPVQALIARAARLPRTSGGAAVLVAYVSVAAGVVHWGLGAVVGAFMAREVGRSAARAGRRFHYPLLGAAGYMGLLVWHGGLSGSAPLVVATEDHFLADRIGQIEVSATLGSPLNLAVTGALVVFVPLLFWLLAPRRDEDVVGFDAVATGPDLGPDPEERERTERRSAQRLTPATRLEESRAVALAFGGAGLAWLLWRLLARGATFDLDAVNGLFLFTGLLAQGTPIRYVRAVADGVRGCAGIILQFPFYFGILGVLKASGLIGTFASALADLASERTLGVFAFVSAGIVNLFVPSGGGQWAVQGEVLVDAAQLLGADMGHTVMAFAYGDQLTNLLQPFWALPLLGITGLKARQIVGYTATVMLLVAPLIAGLLLVLY